MDEIAGFQARDVGDHVSEKCVGGDVKRNAQAHVRAALIQLTRQFTVGDVKLAQRVTRWQRHLWEIYKIETSDGTKLYVSGRVGESSQLATFHGFNVPHQP